MGALKTKRLDEVVDGDDKMFVTNAVMDFSSVSCEGGHAKFTVGFKDADGDCGSLFNKLWFDGMLADFLTVFTGMVCHDLRDDDSEEIYLEDMGKTPVRVVYREGRPYAIGHFLDDRFIMEEDVKAWLKGGGNGQA